jgi:hypothetical protein
VGSDDVGCCRGEDDVAICEEVDSEVTSVLK